MELTLDMCSLNVYKALASEARLQILQILANNPATITELSKNLHLSKPIVSRHIKDLENAQLIHLRQNSNEDDKRKKQYTLSVDNIQISFPKQLFLPFKQKTIEIKLGYFSDFHAKPSCGLASNKSIIGTFDDPRSFVLNERIDASLLWFADGYVEYMIPNFFEENQFPEMLDVSFEISSEFPESNNNWPSDITFYINDISIGTWTCPGNFSDVRGKLTPDWWDSNFSQYGVLKHLRISKRDTGIDGHKISDVKLSDLNLGNSKFIRFKIGIDKNAKNKGGLTIFGDNFGNYEQNILFTGYFSEKEYSNK